MTDKEMVFGAIRGWEINIFEVLNKLTKENVKNAKERLVTFELAFDELIECYENDISFEGRLKDLRKAIIILTNKIKELEENQ